MGAPGYRVERTAFCVAWQEVTELHRGVFYKPGPKGRDTLTRGGLRTIVVTVTLTIPALNAHRFLVKARRDSLEWS